MSARGCAPRRPAQASTDETVQMYVRDLHTGANANPEAPKLIAIPAAGVGSGAFTTRTATSAALGNKNNNNDHRS